MLRRSPNGVSSGVLVFLAKNHKISEEGVEATKPGSFAGYLAFVVSVAFSQ